MAESIRQRVYIETTIPSFCYEVRTEPEMIARRNWTRAWWDNRRHAYRPVTSAAVIDELQAGAFPNKEQALALLDDIPLVPVEPAIIEIVETYIQRMVMPRDPTGDALHLALASYHKCDFLLTWNVQHRQQICPYSPCQCAVELVYPSASDATGTPCIGERRCKTTRPLLEFERYAIGSLNNSAMIPRN
jgi:predicted nucleic acid-binding protein